ncbi:MAG: hypothetical protein C0393_08915, partial [Anaerolinea sp.]|nr:hypothetical protein [Anaerolinea sp.]
MDTENIFVEFEKYLRRRFPERRTPVDYLSDLRQFRSVCQKPWREISMHDIDAFVEQQRASRLKSATVRRRVAAVKTFFDFLAEESGDLSWPNPVRFKRHAGKVERRLPRDLRDEDIERVWHEIGYVRDRAWFALMVRGGLRVGEVVTLKVSDVLNQPEGERPARIRVEGKGRKERVVWLSADAYAVLAEWLAERGESRSAHIFLNERGQPLSANGIEWLLHRYGRQAGIDLTPHQLRHTFARQLTEAGMPVTSLGKLMGHAQISTTQIYTAGADPQLAQAYQTAMQRLEQPCLDQARQPSCATLPLPRAENLPIADAQSLPAVRPIPRPEPPAPEWDSWAPHLPEAIRQASLDYIKRRWSAWPASRRRGCALNMLSELKNLWDWFLAHRPICAPGELGLRDLWDYQTDQQAEDYAAGTINRRLDYVLGIARELAERDQPVDQSVF